MTPTLCVVWELQRVKERSFTSWCKVSSMAPLLSGLGHGGEQAAVEVGNATLAI